MIVMRMVVRMVVMIRVVMIMMWIVLLMITIASTYRAYNVLGPVLNLCMYHLM